MPTIIFHYGTNSKTNWKCPALLKSEKLEQIIVRLGVCGKVWLSLGHGAPVPRRPLWLHLLQVGAHTQQLFHAVGGFVVQLDLADLLSTSELAIVGFLFRKWPRAGHFRYFYYWKNWKMPKVPSFGTHTHTTYFLMQLADLSSNWIWRICFQRQSWQLWVFFLGNWNATLKKRKKTFLIMK